MKKRIKRKDRGASLSEMLAAVLILLLATLVIAAGISTGLKVYRQMTVKEDAQTLLGTAAASLNNDFASADLSRMTSGELESMKGKSNEKDSVSFYSADRGYDITFQNDERRGIVLVTGDGGSGSKTSELPGVSAAGKKHILYLLTDKTMTLDLSTRIRDIYLKKIDGEEEQYAFCYTIDVIRKDSGKTIDSKTVWINDLS